jgi:hypothetical protein
VFTIFINLSDTGVIAGDFLFAFYNIYGRMGEVLFYSSVSNPTWDCGVQNRAIEYKISFK